MGIYNIKVITYNNETQVTFYNYGISKGEDNVKTNKQFTVDNKQLTKDSQQDNDDSFKEIENRKRSTRRSKQNIYELARANEWEYFATFTFADNRYDYKLCKDRLRRWLAKFKERKCKDFEWLCVPEKHKDGAIHFHALLKGNIKPFLAFKGWNEQKYVFTNYKLGFSEIEPIKDTNRVSMYITKYVTKDLLSEVGNARRYFYSSGVKKPQTLEIYSKLELMDFLDENFPDKTISYSSETYYKNNLIQYIQLKNKKNFKKI